MFRHAKTNLLIPYILTYIYICWKRVNINDKIYFLNGSKFYIYILITIDYTYYYVYILCIY